MLYTLYTLYITYILYYILYILYTIYIIYSIHYTLLHASYILYTAGEVLVSEGPIMAASDKFEIKVHGKGGHGAAPHQTVDAIVEAATLISSLQTIVSRNIDPLDAGVITCGRYM